MHDPKLTHQERKLLEGIEEGLRGDRSLNRTLRTLGQPHAGSGAGVGWEESRRRRLGWCTTVLGGASVALFLLAATSSSSAPLWIFAAVWVVTVVCLTTFLRFTVHHRRGRGRAPDGGGAEPGGDARGDRPQP
ncbi:hypothetical protein [Streptomyces zaomyceticus]|uniref:hypothetical protein n=1 Tax=Streptomyces zaomyceticus TaxID=68286 RepID=UPI00167325B1|nr:hypothetical protein [Streptomyces zaomyceticus]GHG26764.1 hypothetical protein GCM10018791_48320 [Streptomyces zaomyceticus]